MGKIRASSLNRKSRGITLLEVILVLAIASAVMLLIFGFIKQRTDDMRRTRTSLQMQQILNAGMSFYVAFNRWPTDKDELERSGYLPPIPANPWGEKYFIKSYQNRSLFVYTNVVNPSNALLIKGKLTLAFIGNPFSTSTNPPTQGACVSKLTSNCFFVVSSVSLPQQNLNNADDLTFVGLYHSGACVPVPHCPLDKNNQPMTPEIMVVPTSVTGAYDPFNSSQCTVVGGYPSCSNYPVYPVTGYTARATQSSDVSLQAPPNCSDSSKHDDCYSDQLDGQQGTRISSGTYWRVCLSVSTPKGNINPGYQSSPMGTGQGQAIGTILAITRCKPSDDKKGSDFNVWTW
jgi:type II secretory pathway pseudopilin PulG